MAKLIQAKDLRGERRERLIDAVPLPAPWTMFVDCGNPCNLWTAAIRVMPAASTAPLVILTYSERSGARMS
jgi:hypothetical protein